MRHLLPAAALACCSLLSLPVAAKDDLLETLAQKGVLSLEEYEKLKAAKKTEVTVSADEGLKVSTADGSSSFQLGTLQQIDVASYRADQADLADGSELRCSRLSVSGSFLKDWQYRFEQEFAGTAGVTDAYVSYTAMKPLVVTVGQFKQPFGMDSLSADKSIAFMERGLPFAFFSSRAPGIQLASAGASWSISGGLFGEPLGNAQAGDEGLGLAARATWAPVASGDRVIHLGFAGMQRYPTAESSTNAGTKFAAVRFRSKPESNLLAQRLVDTGEVGQVDDYRLLGVELGAQRGALSVQAEGHLVQVDRQAGSTLDFNGWYAQLAWTLTGEARPYKVDKGVFEGIRPRRNLGKEGWGAFELAGRVSGIDLGNNTVDGGLERNAPLALNWNLNPLLRVSANVVQVLDVEGGAFDSDEPTIYQMRLQLAI